jgi:hypothetical protein
VKEYELKYSTLSKEQGVVSKITGYLFTLLPSFSTQHTEESFNRYQFTSAPSNILKEILSFVVIILCVFLAIIRSICPFNTGAFLLSFYELLSINVKAIDAIFFEQEKSEDESDFSSISSVSPLDIGFNGNFRLRIHREENHNLIAQSKQKLERQ